MADVTVVGICENGFLGQNLIPGDPSVSVEDCKETLRNLLGYREFRVFPSYEDFLNARLEELKRVRNFTVALSPEGEIKRVYYNKELPREPEEWVEEFDNYDNFAEFEELECYDRVLRKAETDEGKEFLKELGWHFTDGGHYPF